MIEDVIKKAEEIELPAVLSKKNNSPEGELPIVNNLRDIGAIKFPLM